MLYIIDVARLARHLDQLVRLDDTQGRAISEHVECLYPCHAQQDYADYIAAVMYYAVDRLPGFTTATDSLFLLKIGGYSYRELTEKM